MGNHYCDICGEPISDAEIRFLLLPRAVSDLPPGRRLSAEEFLALLEREGIELEEVENIQFPYPGIFHYVEQEGWILPAGFVRSIMSKTPVWMIGERTEEYNRLKRHFHFTHKPTQVGYLSKEAGDFATLERGDATARNEELYPGAIARLREFIDQMPRDEIGDFWLDLFHYKQSRGVS